MNTIVNLPRASPLRIVLSFAAIPYLLTKYITGFIFFHLVIIFFIIIERDKCIYEILFVGLYAKFRSDARTQSRNGDGFYRRDVSTSFVFTVVCMPKIVLRNSPRGGTTYLLWGRHRRRRRKCAYIRFKLQPAEVRT